MSSDHDTFTDLPCALPSEYNIFCQLIQPSTPRPFHPHHGGFVLLLPLVDRVRHLRDQMIRLVAKILDRRTQGLRGQTLGARRLDFEQYLVHERVRMLVAGEFHRRIPEELHAQQVTDRVILLVERERARVRYLRVGGVFDLFLIVVEDERC